MQLAGKYFQPVWITKLAVLLCSALLVSCGGSSTTAGIGGTGITSGEVTGFGSIFVNGVEFNTDNSQFVIDGNTFTSQADALAAGLAVGMVARVNGDTDANGLTGAADSVVYENFIEGPVEAPPIPVPGSGGTQLSFTIFGQEIIINQTSTSFVGAGFSTVAMNDLVEISGFHAPDSSIHATFVAHKGILAMGVSEVELKGTVNASSPTSLTLGGVFSGITINISPTTIVNAPGGLTSGLFVEVEGVITGSTSIDAAEIKVEDNDFGESVEHISLQGIVANSQGLGKFTIDNQLVDVTTATISPAGAVIQNGADVEIKGSIVGGMLIADKVEVR